jgi:hypothetical protein
MFATSDSVGAPTSHLDAPVGRLVLAPLASGKQLRCRGAPPATSFEGQGSKLRQWHARVLPQLKWWLCLQVSTELSPGSVLDVVEGTAARLQAMFFAGE